MMRLRDQVAIVTGGADGIGKATVLRFIEEGAKVVIADLHNEKGEALAQHIRNHGGTAIHVACDVSSSENMCSMVDETIKEFGKIDILHNNAAIDFSAPLIDMEEADWNKVINTNLSSVYRGCKYVVPHMIQNGGGSIINTSSVQAFLGFHNYSAYAAAKGGIISLTQQLAVELALYRIRVNSLSPGTILTPMTIIDIQNSDDPKRYRDELNQLHALNRMGEPREVADVVLFLASNESSFITGTDIKVDGGMMVKPW
jgi:NAD(P)-dependent dehydrogenase (short-subunit alcohol dehydrogenase family)